MGWAIGYDSTWDRDIGYGVPATCDHPGCGAEIDRGLAYVCGDQPYGGDHGCGLFFCAEHRRAAGKRRGFSHLCDRCYRNDEPFDPTPDIPDWIAHKLTDESWEQWREDNPEVVEYLLAIAPTHPAEDRADGREGDCNV